jgi:hypothetical protein
MNCALFIRSYWKDLEWLALCLRAIERHCYGFSEVVVVVPESTRAWLVRRPLPGGARLLYCPLYGDDYLGQQVTKLHADSYTQADLIVHVDADCIFTRATGPRDLAPGYLPVVVTRPVTELGRHYPWQRPTQEFLGFEVDLDFMQQPPFAYPRWLYPLVRQHCQQLHGQSIEEHVLSRPPRGFSEFNVLGAYAHRHHGKHFAFCAADSPHRPAPRCDWYWSWGGITPAIRGRIEAALATPTSAPTV